MSQSCALTLLLDISVHFPCVQISSISSSVYCNIHILITTSNNFRGNQIDNVLISQRNEYTNMSIGMFLHPKWLPCSASQRDPPLASEWSSPKPPPDLSENHWVDIVFQTPFKGMSLQVSNITWVSGSLCRCETGQVSFNHCNKSPNIDSYSNRNLCF